METRIVQRLEDIAATDWNRVSGTAYPFTRYEFLVALERHRCVGDEYGWLPRHVTLWERGLLVGAVPLYLKYNSYGELVFDWSWASAYERNGLPYYPKLVSAVPYTPATGRRLLLAPDTDADVVRQHLVQAVTALARDLDLSSIHWLFPTDEETHWLESRGLMSRTGCQFHWRNPGYGSFDDFLATLRARKRKNIRHERQRVADAEVKLEVRLGGDVTHTEWTLWQRLYESTFERKSGIPTLSLDFFLEIGRALPEQVVMFFARRHGDIIAGAFCLRGDDTLYGRHWGTFESQDSLHFETCYYQGIDYCIGEGIARFEPGAQGEHKISRGFLPVRTWSAHWIAHDGFRDAIARFLDQERAAMADYMEELAGRSPYRDQV